ncbi:hypothetical protein [Anaerostipes caccae]|uniref:hypothetical protein n=1 Tax=Anaerostipes caccae TaxID=105841 RepID=UPI0038D3B52F
MIIRAQKKMETGGVFNSLLVIQILLLFFLPPLDGKMNLIRIIIYTMFAAISVVLVLLFLREAVFFKKIKFNLSFWSVSAFFGMCGVSALWGITRGISITDIIRGILPFVWFIYIIILTQRLTYKSLEHMIKIISVVSICYAARIFLYYFIFVFGHAYERVTFHLVQATSIMPMIGSLILGYYFIDKNLHNSAYFAASIFCYISVILTATKSMLMALIAGWVILGGCFVLFIRRKGFAKKLVVKRIVMMGISLLVCTGIITAGTGLGDRWRSMITFTKTETSGTSETVKADNETEIKVDEGSVSVRIIELKTALKNYMDSPFLGQGIGYRWKADGLDYGGPVIYMHNIIAFIMQDFGTMGLIYILLILIFIFRMIYKVFKIRLQSKKKRKDILLYFSIIAMSFCYANFFAVFRSIEFVVLCSIFIAAFILEYESIVCGMDV